MSIGRIIKGIEADRATIRGAALNIIRKIVERPLTKSIEKRTDWLRPPPLSAFKRLEPLGFGIKNDVDWFFNPKECKPDVLWPIEVGMVADHEDGDISLSKAISISAKMARGHADRFGPFMVRMDHAQTIGGELQTCAGIFVWLGGKWADASKKILWEGRWAEEAIPHGPTALALQDRLQPMLATAVALRQRYEWAVSLGLEDSPSVRFVTDPTGIKDVFRIRDLPEGRDRREALLNWVTDHWRQDRRDPEMEIYVRKHLRGATAFNWRGMEGEILPSQFDMDQREKLIADRAAMKLAHTDQRAKAG